MTDRDPRAATQLERDGMPDIEVIRTRVAFDHLRTLAVRPRHGNRSRSVEDPQIRRRLAEIVDLLVQA